MIKYVFLVVCTHHGLEIYPINDHLIALSINTKRVLYRTVQIFRYNFSSKRNSMHPSETGA